MHVWVLIYLHRKVQVCIGGRKQLIQESLQGWVGSMDVCATLMVAMKKSLGVLLCPPAGFHAPGIILLHLMPRLALLDQPCRWMCKHQPLADALCNCLTSAQD